jgi:hypothetical protein
VDRQEGDRLEEAAVSVDTRVTITPEHQARLDGLAAALTDTVKQALLGDPQFIERLLEAQRFQTHEEAMKVRDALRAQLRAWEELHSLPHSFATRAEQRPRTAGGHTKEAA